MSIQNDQVVDLSARSNIASVINEQLDNEMALIEDRFKYPFRVTVSSTTIAISAGIFNTLKSDGSDGTTNSYVWRNSFFGDKDAAISNMSLNVSAGTASGPNGPVVCPSVTANNWIQIGIELRADLMYQFVWGTPNAVKASTTRPRFSHGAIQVCVVYLQKNGSSGTWGFLAPNETDVEIIKFNKIHVSDSPVRMYTKRDTNIYFDLDEYMDSDGAGVKEAMLNGLFPSVVASSYDFQNANPNTTGNTFVGTTTRPTTNSGEFRRVGFTLLGSGNIHVIWSTNSVTEGGLADPSTLFLAKGYPIGWVDLQGLGGVNYKSLNAATSVIEASTANATNSAIVPRIHRILNTNVNPEDYIGDEFFGMYNLSLTATASSNQITLGLRSADGSNFSTSNCGILNFKNSTATTGTLLKTVLTANPTDFVVSAGASLGLKTGVAGNFYFYVYARYESPTSVTLAVTSHSLEEGSSHTSVAMSASANTLKTLYAIDATNKQVRCVGIVRATKDASDNWTDVLLIQPAPQGNQNRQVNLIDPSTESGFEFKELSSTPASPPVGYKKLYSESHIGFTDKFLRYIDATYQVTLLDQRNLLLTEGIHNLCIDYGTASGGAFTVTLKGAQNQNLATSNHGFIMFRDNNNSTSGRTYPCYLSGNLTVTLDSGATLGLPSATTSRIYVYAIYQSSSSAVLAVSSMLFTDHFTKASTTLDSSADNAGTLYADTGVSANSVRLIGYIEALHTNGTWSTPTKAYCGINPSIQVLNQTYPENYIDNPEFIISQRGDFETSPINPVTNNYYVDRWKVDSNAGNGNYTLQTASTPLTDLPVLPMSKQTQIMKLTLTGSNFSGYMTTFQPLEYSSRFQQKVTWLSCWVKSNNANARIMMYDGINYLGATSNNHSGGGNWEYLSCPILATTGNLKAYVGIIGTSSGAANVTINTGHYVYFTAMKYEVGPNPTPFVSRSYADELYRCQRYCWVPSHGSNRSGAGLQNYYTVNSFNFCFYPPTTMRTTPVLIQTGASELTDWQLRGISGDSSQTGFSIAIGGSSTPSCPQITATKTAHGLTSTVFFFYTQKVYFSSDL